MDWNRLKPSYWVQNDPTSPSWDIILNRALDQFGVSEITQHTCKVGPLTVWIENWPYAYGRSYSAVFPNTGLPKVATRKRLRSEICKATLAMMESWPDKSRLKVVN